MIGIYKITSPSEKVYIGQSINIEKRRQGYQRLYCKDQTRLYNSLVKYGFSQHVFEVVEECTTNQLNVRERYWQDFYKAIGERGLNCFLTETDSKPRVYSQDYINKVSTTLKAFYKTPQGKVARLLKSKQRIAFEKTQEGLESRRRQSTTLKAINKTPEGVARIARQVSNTDYLARGKRRYIAILQYEKNNTFIKEWSSGKEASETLGVRRSNITDCLKGRLKSAGGFIWKYKEI